MGLVSVPSTPVLPAVLPPVIFSVLTLLELGWALGSVKTRVVSFCTESNCRSALTFTTPWPGPTILSTTDCRSAAWLAS